MTAKKLKPIYRLSNRQRDKAERGTEIKVALPRPRRKPLDIVAWARDVLDVPPEMVVDAEEMVVWVSPQKRGTGLPNVIGAICPEEHRDDHWCWQVSVVVAKIVDGEPEYYDERIQWPAVCEFDGELYGKDRVCD